MASKANIVIDQGANFYTTVSLTDTEDGAVDLTGYTAAGQIRKHYTSLTAVDFDITIDVQLGTLILTLSSQTTNSMQPGRYVYDVEMTSSTGVVSRVVEGIATVTPSVTR